MAPEYVKELIHSNTLSYSAAYQLYNDVYARNWDETEAHIRRIIDNATEKVAQSIPELAKTISEDTEKAKVEEESREKVEMPSGKDAPVIVSPTGMTVNFNDVPVDDDNEKDSSEKKPEGNGRRNNEKVNKAPKPVVSKTVKEKVSKLAPDSLRKEIKRSIGGSVPKGSQPVISQETAKQNRSRVDFLIQKIKDSKLPTDNKMFMLLESLAQNEGDYKIGDAFDIYNQFIGN